MNTAALLDTLQSLKDESDPLATMLAGNLFLRIQIVSLCMPPAMALVDHNMYRPPGAADREIFFFIDCWPQNLSEKVRTTLRIHLDQVSGQTVDSRPISDQI